MAKKDSYDENSIVKLEYPDNVRKRTGMYLGGVTQEGANQACYEIISNAVDEYLAGHCTEVYVKIDTKSNNIVICDNGRGMPVGKNKQTGKLAIEMIVADLHAGGKMDSKNYKNSGGLNGVGAAASNAVSDPFIVQTFRDGKWWEIGYSKGVLKNKLKEIKPNARFVSAFKTGTQVSIVLDPLIFKAHYKLNVTYFKDLIQDLSYLCSGLKLYLEVNGKVEEFHEENGAEAYALDSFDVYFEGKEDVKSLQGKKPYVFKSEQFEMSLLWTSDNEEHWGAYTNCIHNQELGTHVDAVRNVIDTVFKKVFSGTYKGTILRQGLLGFISLKLNNDEVDYKGQNKSQMTSSYSKKYINESDFPKEFENWVRNNSAAAKIHAFANSRMKANNNMNKELEAIAKDLEKEFKDKLKRKHIVCAKLKDAYGVPKEEREIFIVEGESAGGTLMQARDDDKQAVLLLKGKIPNAWKDKLKAIYANEDIKNIYMSMAIIPGDRKAVPKVEKLIFMADPDVDGKHINSLLIGLLAKTNPELFTDEKIFVVVAPLYALTDSKGKKYYAYNDKEKDALLKKTGAKMRITRMKGWGEASPDFIEEFAMNPETRQLKQIKISDKSLQKIEEIMGEDVQFRKELLNIEIRETEVVVEA